MQVTCFISRNDILGNDDEFGDLRVEPFDYEVSGVRGRGVANDPLLPWGFNVYKEFNVGNFYSVFTIYRVNMFILVKKPSLDRYPLYNLTILYIIM